MSGRKRGRATFRAESEVSGGGGFSFDYHLSRDEEADDWQPQKSALCFIN